MLKILIQSACQEGTISDSDKEIIYRKAQQQGIKREVVDKLIAQEIEKNSSDGLESGFMPIDEMPTTDNNSQQNIVSAEQEQTKFTNQEPLSSQGAMSTVYQAKLYGKWIIIKRIKPQYKNNAKYRELFIREFENAYHLDHPHIVRLLDKGEDAEGLYYTMEYIDGRALSEMIKKDGLGNDKLAEKIARQIIDALIYVHKKQIYHRDLKPDNIYLTYKGDNVKILDFGLAAADNFDDNLAKAGTPRYASPEQMNPQMNIDQRSDIYSFGKIFLEMLTGTTDIASIDKVHSLSYRYIIEKSLATDRQQRFNDCDEILEIFNNPNLVPKSKSVKKAVKKNSTKTSTKEKTGKSNKKTLLAVMIGIGIVALLLGVYFLFLKRDNIKILPAKDNTNIVLKADSLFNVGEFVKAKNAYEKINKKNEHVNKQISILDGILKKFDAANKVFEGKNIARALGLYQGIAKDYPNFKGVTEKIKDCKSIIRNADFNKLQVVPESSTNKLGFADSKGNVVVDYQFDKVAPLKDWHKIGLIPVQIAGKYGFIDRNKNYFAKCIYSSGINGKYVWLPKGYRVKKNGHSVFISVDRNGNGTIK